jgi:hypothetical protein
VELKGIHVFVIIEVVDAPLDYNLLLGHTWFYEIPIITSSLFHLLQFLYQWKIMIIDQLDSYMPDINNQLANNVPFLGHFNLEYESVGVGLHNDSSLMGVFPLHPSHPPN